VALALSNIQERNKKHPAFGIRIVVNANAITITSQKPAAPHHETYLHFARLGRMCLLLSAAGCLLVQQPRLTVPSSEVYSTK
jgi:hypothetical protein